jgi:hypothetical protein
MSDLLFGREDLIDLGKPQSPPMVAAIGGLRVCRDVELVGYPNSPP